MSTVSERKGWKISEVERLIGLPRRDIQRSCYHGKGGVGILEPRDGSWGRRLYSAEDLGILFIVKQYRDRGYSLPEIKHLLCQSEKAGGYHALAGFQVARLREQEEIAREQVVRGEALRVFLSDSERETKLADLVELCVAHHILISALASPRAVLTTEIRACLEDLLSCRRQGLDPKALEVREIAGDALAILDKARCPGTERVPSPLAEMLNEPGLDLAIELWMGPGSYAYLEEALNI